MLLHVYPHGPVLVDEVGIPRYWAAAWALFHCGGLAPSTLKAKLSHIEALYEHVFSLGGCLDDALSGLDFERLGSSLEAFFVKLRNRPDACARDTARWTCAFLFVRETCERLERDPALANRMAGIRERIARLDRLYLGLRPYRKRFSRRPRALPRLVLTELLDAVTPGSLTNPFKGAPAQWRVFALVSLLLYQGLRRGEALLLPADCLISERHPRDSSPKWRLNVATNEAEDPRATRPSIKTVESVRTVPVSPQTAQVLLAYAENYRGSVDHAYYLSSTRGLPLSLEGVNKALQKLTTALSAEAQKQLFELTGYRNLTPHALRHTCAVVRMKQLLASGHQPEQAMMLMRSFFGWSKASLMPLHYAKAALDERLNELWDDRLDSRLELLRSLPQ